jgi:hypothetical protein
MKSMRPASRSWPRQYHGDLIGKLASAGETPRRIQALRVHISFDDFGTGYASLTYLKKFSLDGLRRTTRLPFRPADASCGVRGSFPDEKRHAF